MALLLTPSRQRWLHAVTQICRDSVNIPTWGPPGPVCPSRPWAEHGRRGSARHTARWLALEIIWILLHAISVAVTKLAALFLLPWISCNISFSRDGTKLLRIIGGSKGFWCITFMFLSKGHPNLISDCRNNNSLSVCAMKVSAMFNNIKLFCWFLTVVLWMAGVAAFDLKLWLSHRWTTRPTCMFVDSICAFLPLRYGQSSLQHIFIFCVSNLSQTQPDIRKKLQNQKDQ